LGEHGAGRGEAKVLGEVLAKDPHRDRVEEQRALSGEADQPFIRVKLQDLGEVEVVFVQFVP